MTSQKANFKICVIFTKNERPEEVKDRRLFISGDFTGKSRDAYGITTENYHNLGPLKIQCVKFLRNFSI